MDSTPNTRRRLCPARLIGVVVLLLVVLGDSGLLAGNAVTGRPNGPTPVTETTPAAGMFLVATRQLRDPNFSRTVVLLLRYDDEGAMGLVVNRPTDIPLSHLIPRLERLRERSDRAFQGGPVMQGSLVMLLWAESAPDEEAAEILDHLYLSRDPKLLERIIGENRPDEDEPPEEAPEFRVYRGYAGWAPGQLDAEIERGDWHLAPGSGLTVFDERPEEVWGRLIPKDPSRWVRLDLSFWSTALCLMGAQAR